MAAAPLLRFWEPKNGERGEELMSLDMLLLDSKVNMFLTHVQSAFMYIVLEAMLKVFLNLRS